MELSNPAVMQAVLKKHGFTFSKALGQNFLTDPTVCPRMAASCGASDGVGVLEVGPGLGVLTRELSAAAARVVTVELDARLLPVLAETLDGCGNVQVIHGDILKLDLPALVRAHFPGGRYVVCANLPYYITSPVIMHLLESETPPEAITVMVQKEVADRLCAVPGTKDAGAVTVCVDYYAAAQKLFPVPKGSFYPVPKVDSAVIRLTKRPAPPVDVGDKEAFFRLVKAAFAQRRKTACNSVSNTLGIPKAAVAAALNAVGADENARSETLTTAQLAALAKALFNEE
ncbi:MAG: 16S rRNA (adenine(1518)-N(6)/adenine(1519)-N(6))-dimethyltransferase RsmA [Clostridia bacterium]|nr:16S rRNA (adenine(1518)-N(6)/adenine(1519)-N(6))-dimethyltransferase RsmA [Clostridia bacterium]